MCIEIMSKKKKEKGIRNNFKPNRDYVCDVGFISLSFFSFTVILYFL